MLSLRPKLGARGFERRLSRQHALTAPSLLASLAALFLLQNPNMLTNLRPLGPPVELPRPIGVVVPFALFSSPLCRLRNSFSHSPLPSLLFPSPRTTSPPTHTNIDTTIPVPYEPHVSPLPLAFPPFLACTESTTTNHTLEVYPAADTHTTNLPSSFFTFISRLFYALPPILSFTVETLLFPSRWTFPLYPHVSSMVSSPCCST